MFNKDEICIFINNNYKNMNSTIHENQTQSHLEHSITDIQELYTNFNYSK